MRFPFGWNPIEDWKRVLRFAWTVKLAVLAGLLSAITVIMGVMISCGSSRMYMFWFIVVSVSATVVTFLIGPARIIEQPNTLGTKP
jgi:hypothetical protein